MHTVNGLWAERLPPLPKARGPEMLCTDHLIGMQCSGSRGSPGAGQRSRPPAMKAESEPDAKIVVGAELIGAVRVIARSRTEPVSGGGGKASKRGGRRSEADVSAFFFPPPLPSVSILITLLAVLTTATPAAHI